MRIMCKMGVHEKVKSKFISHLTDPPQQSWICRLCGERGKTTFDAWDVDRDSEYGQLERKFPVSTNGDAK